uniref:Endonuclease/exonuclease/phosphatase domain-containing protein n=1 Tax=Gouania willdenowi TaxID=441366 RepID=A0A8C5N645_GOUWI
MLSSIGQDLRFTSFNFKVLNNPIKDSKVLHHLQQLGACVIFLQETHLRNVDHLKSFSGKARGIAILLHKSVPSVSDQIISNANGRHEKLRNLRQQITFSEFV